ncbi:3408_t:CDS:2 [Cetraspora pellucida]|uniref:3408_t:CDS:1 n=1 Tax=Cetraspora pellucida TaxID=1433469 RepID=A0A9N8ZC96_9GLOM|nr:3408_t:CDS:2 [Cetraspora pellucida]
MPQSQENFMKLKRKMSPSPLPPKIRRKCNEFVVAFNENHQVELMQRIKHDGTWKESEKQLAKVTDRILDTLRDTWNNPAFRPEFAGFLSEGTYGLSLEKSNFVSSSELQSSTSADRKVKLWRECNDRIYWARKSSRPNKDEFGIIGVQIAGTMICVLIRDSADVHRYYHLREAEIPIRQSNPIIVANFIEVLLILRNILIVNIDLLYNALIPRMLRKVEDSSTVSSSCREGEQKRTRKKDKEKTNFIVKLKENNKEKTDLIVKLKYDVSLIKEQDKSMVCNQIISNVLQDVEPGISDSYSVNSNDVPEDINLLYNDNDITNIASNSDEHQEETSF